MAGTQEGKGIRVRPSHSILALLSFIASFGLARTFTSISPDIVLVRSGLHIHHFWYGLILLSIGGWVGISYDSERTNRWAAAMFGAGGGLVGDEIGLPLTFGDYWTGITYSVIIILMSLFGILILMTRYRGMIEKNFWHILRGHPSFYLGFSSLVVSVIFIAESRSDLITSLSTVVALSAILCIISRWALRRQNTKKSM